MRIILALFAFLLAFNLVMESDREDPPSTEYRVTSSWDEVARVHSEYDGYRAHRHRIEIDIARVIRQTATDQGIPLGLAFSIVDIESDFITDAVSHAGAVGLTQVMPATGLAHCDLTRSQLFDPELNVPCGLSYLKMLHDRYGDWSVALAAYNVGDARRKRAWRTGEPDGSSYAARVLEGAS